MEPFALFHFCPRCGSPAAPDPVFHCASCGLVLHHSPAVATAVFLRRESDGRWLFIRRAKEPSLGKIAPPGGFLDIGEPAETGAAREVFEETGLEVRDLAYVGAFPNSYLYKDVLYPVQDIFYRGTASEEGPTPCPDEVEEILWLNTDEIDPAELAFPSMQAAWERLRNSL